jgi:hypothetical protein
VDQHQRVAYADVKNRPDRAVGCSRCWAATGVGVAGSEDERARGRRVRPFWPGSRRPTAQARRAEWAHDLALSGTASPEGHERAGAPARSPAHLLQHRTPEQVAGAGE